MRYLLLFFLAAIIPEVLTGSTPFWQLLNPFTLLGLMIIYGVPALMIREYVMSRGGGYRSVLVLGLLEGILVEGLAVNTFYSDKMGVLSSHGRFLGVNWVLAFYITLFHAIFSVLVPIMIFDTFYSGRLVSKLRAWYLVPVALIVLLFNLSEEVYRPSPVYWLLSLLMMGLVFAFYRKLGERRLPGPSLPPQLAYLYPSFYIILAFYGLAGRVHPLIHLLVWVPFFTTLYNALEDVDSWLFSRRLLLGLILVSFIVAIADNKGYVIPPALAFLLFVVYVDRRVMRRQGQSADSETLNAP